MKVCNILLFLLTIENIDEICDSFNKTALLKLKLN